MAAPLEKTELAVGDSTRLEIIFNTQQYDRMITKRPRIETNQAGPDHYVVITTRVVPDSVATSPLLISGWPIIISGPADSVETDHSFELTNTSAVSLDLTLVDVAATHFDIDIVSHLEPGQTAICGVSIHPDVIGEAFTKSLTIEVSDSAHTRFTIPVGRIVP